MSHNGADMRSPIFYEVMLHEAKRSVKQDESKNEGFEKSFFILFCEPHMPCYTM
jgi:hypothetical protein